MKMNSDDPRFRDVIDISVHRAVTDVTGGDGCGNCDIYALAGMILLREVTGENYQLQLGSMMFLTDPAGHGWFEIDATNGGLDRLEYHAWLGRPGKLVTRGDGNEQPDYYSVGELVDFSVRHFRSMVTRMPQIKSATAVDGGFLLVVDPNAERVAWTRPDEPPVYLWVTGDTPDDFHYKPDADCTLGYYKQLANNRKFVSNVTSRVMTRYRETLELL